VSFYLRLFLGCLLLVHSSVWAGSEIPTVNLSDVKSDFQVSPYLIYKKTDDHYNKVGSVRNQLSNYELGITDGWKEISLYAGEENASRDPTWFAFKLFNPSTEPQEFLLELKKAFKLEMHVFIYAGEKLVASHVSGFDVPFEQRPVANRFQLFPISALPGQELVIIIYDASDVEDNVNILSLWERSNYYDRIDFDSVLHWLYFGAVAVMVFFNFVVFLIVGDRSYFYYVVSGLFIGLTIFATSGFAFQLLWPNHPEYNQYFISLFYVISLVFLVLFGNAFLDLPQHFPKISKLLFSFLAILVFVVFPLRMWGDSQNRLLATDAMMLFDITFSLLLWFVSLTMSLHGSKIARYYFLAWTTFLIGLFVSSLYRLGLFPHNIYFAHSVKIGQLFELVLMSIALAGRMNILKESAKLATAANMAKSSFLAKMSHEIRTPMNGILGMSDLLKGMRLDEQQKAAVEVINSSSKSLLGILNDILDFSKIEAGKMNLERVDFNIEELVEGVLSIFRLKAEIKKVSLFAEIDPLLPLTLTGDPTRLRQIITNLLGNAFKFTESGEILIEVKLVNPKEKLVKIMVSDTGIGISEQAIENLFLDFSQAENDVYRRYGGTGLGLAITQQLVQLMDGEIGVLSKESKGSTFWFTLPLIPIGAGVGAVTPPQSLPLPLRLLIGSDNSFFSDHIRDQAELLGFRVTQLTTIEEISGKLAITQKANDIYSLVIMDFDDVDSVECVLSSDIRLQTENIEQIVVVFSRLKQRDFSDDFPGAGNIIVREKPLYSSELRAFLEFCVKSNSAEDSSGLRNSVEMGGNVIARVKQLKLLVAEDNAISQMVIQKMLERLGHEATVVENGRKAVQAFERSTSSVPFDAILMDCEMPVMDGFAATEMIRKYEKMHALTALPIIALTAHAMDEQKKRCEESGMTEHIAKPIELEVLKLVLEKAVP